MISYDTDNMCVAHISVCTSTCNNNVIHNLDTILLKILTQINGNIALNQTGV